MTAYDKKLTRVKRTLTCREPDRVPLFDLFWVEFLRKWREAKGLGEDANIYEYYDMDLTLVAPNTDPKIESFRLLEKGADYIIYKSGFGCTVKKVDYSPMPQFLDFSVKSADGYEKFEFEDPDAKRRYYEESANLISSAGHVVAPPFDEQIKANKGKTPFMGIVCEGHEKLWRIRGSEGVLLDLALEKEKVKRFLKRIEEFEIRIGLNQIRMGCELLFIAGDVAYDKGMLFSPAMWREFFKSYLFNMCRAFKAERPDVVLVYHGCGNATAIFDDLIECGVDAYHSLEVKSGIDVVALKRKYGKRLAYIGNMDCRDVLPGPREILKNDLLRKLNAAKGGGYIPSADHSVPHSVPVENYDYFVELLRRHGEYPLRLGKYDIPDIRGV
jgi:uroporphyrinogen decarboxylase